MFFLNLKVVFAADLWRHCVQKRCVQKVKEAFSSHNFFYFWLTVLFNLKIKNGRARTVYTGTRIFNLFSFFAWEWGILHWNQLSEDGWFVPFVESKEKVKRFVESKEIVGNLKSIIREMLCLKKIKIKYIFYHIFYSCTFLFSYLF